ncbi:MAG TPA: DUF507 family protein [Bryobacterales bacterium]|nr:DUF507 family protein [Bryobacterales bacterium]
MLLSRAFIAYLARQLAIRLADGPIEAGDPEAMRETIQHLITDELSVEDQINDEVREILGQYSEYMRREGVSYQEMFKRTKRLLLAERKIIRASGRETGDHMKLSRDKVNELSHKLAAQLRRTPRIKFKLEWNDVRLEIVRGLTELLTAEDKIDHAARVKIKSQKREIPEGSEEWDLLFRRYYDEEMKKYGIDLASV